MKSFLCLPCAVLGSLGCFAFLAAPPIAASSATWNASPIDNEWSNAANWTPATVPYGEDDVATFGVSNITDVMLGITAEGDGGNTVSSIVFSPSASTYTITVTAVFGRPSYLVVDGVGIVNSSGLEQNLITQSLNSNSAPAYFVENASAGDKVVITNEGATHADAAGGSTRFWDNSSAGNIRVINEGSTISGTISGGFTDLADYSGAKNAMFISNPGTVADAAAGYTLVQTFPPGGNLGTSTFVANAAKMPGAEGGWVEMDVGTCAGTRFIANGAGAAGCQGGQIYAYGAENETRLGIATYAANGGRGTNAEGGLIDVFHLPLEVQTVVRANPGKNGGLGGLIQLENTDDMPVPQFQVFGNGTMDLSKLTQDLSIGSLAGDGLVELDGHSLSVGSNNLSTVFARVVAGTGNLTKAGTGTFALNGVNTYAGGTTVSAGTLGGSGTVAGNVTVAANATLAPAAGTTTAATFTTSSSLTFQTSSSYNCLLSGKGKKAASDQVVATGVTIQSGAQFVLTDQVTGKLRSGASFVAISNTASTPIAGTFANLPDGGTISVNGTNFQASYEGGDGNDLTLTVQ